MYKFGVFLRHSLLLVFMAILFALPVGAAPALSAGSAILIEADSCTPILEYDADTRRGMASTTKIMTAIVAIENGDLDREVAIPDAAIGTEGSSLYLKPGESMTLRELLYGLMLQSANDSAVAIAITVGGSLDGFVAMMNEKANALGLTNTHFTNPHGLAEDGHYTTARELAVIAAYALKNPIFREICSTQKTTVPASDGVRWLINHNKMLRLYDGAYGVKTGFTKATGRCLVSAAEKDGVRLIAVTLNAPDDWNDHKALLDYGFAEYESICLVSCGDRICALELLGGAAESVDLVAGCRAELCLPKNRGSIVSQIEINRYRFAPVYAGDELGKMTFLLNGKVIASVPLYAAEYVGRIQP